MASLDQWIKDIPIITRTYLIGAFLTTSVCALDIVSPFSLFFNAKLVLFKYQFWRIVTNFFFFSEQFSLDFLFHMFFLARYSRSLEEGPFRGRTADFFYMIVLSAALMLLVSPLVALPFFGASLTFVMVYVWSRRNPYARMNFLGLWTFTAPYLPWVLLGFSILLGGNGMVDVLGIAVGHLYYFLEDVYPRMIPSRTRLLKTPRFIELLFASADDDVAEAPVVVPPPVAAPVLPAAAPAVPAAAAAPAGDPNYNFVFQAAPVDNRQPVPAEHDEKRPAADSEAAGGRAPASGVRARPQRPAEGVAGVSLD